MAVDVRGDRTAKKSRRAQMQMRQMLKTEKEDKPGGRTTEWMTDNGARRIRDGEKEERTRKNTCLFTLDGVEYVSCNYRSGRARDLAWGEVEGSKKTRHSGRQRRASSIILRASPIIEPRRSRQMGRHGTVKVWLKCPFRDRQQEAAGNSHTDKNATLPIPSLVAALAALFLPLLRDPRLEPGLPGCPGQQSGPRLHPAAGARDKIRDQPVADGLCQPSQRDCRAGLDCGQVDYCTWHMEIDHEILHQRLNSHPSIIFPPFFCPLDST